MRKRKKVQTVYKPQFSLGTSMFKKLLSLPYTIVLILAWIGLLPLTTLTFFLKTASKLNPFRVFHHKVHKSRKQKVLVQRHFPIKTAILVAGLFIVFIYYSALLIKFASQLPTPTRLASEPKPLTTQIYDRNGTLLYQFYEQQNRQLITLNQVPQDTINATIAMEDKHFYTHPGVDIFGIIRAIHANLVNGQTEGGSTITQQLVKNSLLTSDQTLKRKVEEAVLSVWAETIYSKSDILQMYFNEVAYGGPTRGIQAASLMYFGKDVSSLDLAESAYLAGLTAAPSQYSPYGSTPEKGKERQAEALKRMVEEGYINQNQADQALAENLNFKTSLASIKAPHFVMYVRSLLAQKYGEAAVTTGGLKVTTTLDLNLQNSAQDIVTKKVPEVTYSSTANGAAMVTDADNGQILAMVGSINYFDPNGGNYNATTALRPPGSSIKPVTYVTAFKQGYSPGNLILDAPITFPNPGSKPYTPNNYDNKFHGVVSLRTALGSSYNIPAVKMLQTVGLPNMIQTAQDLGITTFGHPENFGLSLTLGGGAVKMIDMMSVYNTFATEGIKYQPQAILKVTDSFGNVLEDNSTPTGTRVLTPQVSYLISDILSDNKARSPVFGLYSQLVIPNHTVAVKTGTSDDKRDNWTFGFTPEYVVGVWVGHNDNTPLPTAGSEGAGPVWHDIMSAVLQDRPDIAFYRPDGIIDTLVDGSLDKKIAGVASKSLVTFQKPDTANKDKTGKITLSNL